LLEIELGNFYFFNCNLFDLNFEVGFHFLLEFSIEKFPKIFKKLAQIKWKKVGTWIL